MWRKQNIIIEPNAFGGYYIMKFIKRFSIGLGILMLCAELIYNRLVQSMSTAANISMSVVAAIIMIIGIVLSRKSVKK